MNRATFFFKFPVRNDAARVHLACHVSERVGEVTRGTLAHGAAVADTPGLGRRMGCFIYEGVLLFGVVFATALLYAVLTDQRNAMQGREGLLAVALVLMPGLYLVWYWSHTGQTLPMQTWHIRLITVDGQRVSRWRATLRYLLSWVWFFPALALWHLAGWRSTGSLTAALAGGTIGYALLALLHPQRQFWHDAACGTRLIDTRREVSRAAASTRRMSTR